MATIELINVSHCYMPGQYAVENINLNWENGSSSALLGPSGCGKTTLLKIIAGLLEPTEGDVIIDGEKVNHLKPSKRNLAQVFQFPVVYETLNVFDNLAFPLRNYHYPENIVSERVANVAGILELTPLLHRNAGALGAADQQLVSLGRGIIRDDLSAILLDEPLTVIDPKQRWRLLRKLKELQERFLITMIYVTHDQQEALTFADHVTVMNYGKALQTGSTGELYRRPQTPFVGYFIGSPGMNIFEATLNGNALEAGNYSHKFSEGANYEPGAQTFKIGIRPEFVKITPAEVSSGFACEVNSVHLTGAHKVLDLYGAGLSFKARIGDTARVRVNDTVYAQFPHEYTVIYADDEALSL